MRRVPWTVIGGDDVETVIAMALFNEHKQAKRIRPSQGDFGIDVLVPNESDEKSWDVYQIKKFAQNLDNSQKSQIENSFKRVLIGRARKKVPLADWYLVMPLDPTIQNYNDWFNEMPGRVIKAMLKEEKLKLSAAEKRIIREWFKSDKVIDWKGLPFCDNLMAKYWFVPDYYLFNGEQRINSAINQFKELVAFDRSLVAPEEAQNTAIMEPAELRNHLIRLQVLLDGDPHFSYGISLGPNPTEFSNEPGLIGALQERTPSGGYLVLKVYARFDESLKERPIPGSLTFDFTHEDFDAEAFTDWKRYGRPLTAPAIVSFDFPGGLAVDGRQSIVEIGASPGQTREMRFRIVGEDGVVGNPIILDVATYASPEGIGAWSEGSDASGVLKFESQLDRERETLGYRLGTHQFFGVDAVAALAPLEFISNIEPGNTLQVSEKYGPFKDLMTIEEGQQSFPKSVVQLVSALVEIQELVSEAIKIPEPEDVTEADFRYILEVGELLRGRQIMFSWEKLKLEGTSEMDLEEGVPYRIQSVAPLKVDLPHLSVQVGYIGTTYFEALLSKDEDGDWIADSTEINSAQKEICDPAEEGQGDRILVAFSKILPEQGENIEVDDAG